MGKIKTAREWWLLQSFERLLSWRRETKQEHAIHNADVKSRQVARRQIFGWAMDSVNHQYGGHRRVERRRFARAQARREWLRVQRVGRA